jgi:uncharacterized protein YdcH (DUF465 family)
MPKLTRWLLDEVPVSEDTLANLRTADPAFRTLCDEYESVGARIDRLEADGDNPAEAERLRTRLDALRRELVAFIGQSAFHH